ncbi:MAG: glycosyltransferase [Acidobacteriota bacterium]
MQNQGSIFITGMHCSGTSRAAALLAEAGFGVGRGALKSPADPEAGASARAAGRVFDDSAFRALNRRALLARCGCGDEASGAARPGGGVPEWGWREDEEPSARAEDFFREEALRVLEDLETAAGPAPRVLEDPGASLLLDAWSEAAAAREAPDARFVLLYRAPWDVAEALQRLGSQTLLRRPDYGPRLWDHYCRSLLGFYRRHPERCLLVSASRLAERPEALAELVARRWGLGDPGEAPAEDGPRPSAPGPRAPAEDLPWGDPLPRLFAAVYPQTLELLGVLESEADLASGRRWCDPEGAGGPLRPHRFDPEHDPDASSDEAPVAVVIPCRDMGRWIFEAIASVERSIPEPYDLVIVDDGSTDPATVEIMKRLAEAGYRVDFQPARGVCAARNRAFELARAPYVLPLDADNRLLPGPFLEAAIAELEADPRLGVVHGDRYEFGLREGRVAGADFDLQRMLRGNYIDTCALVRRKTWSDAGGFDEQLVTWEDWELWIRVARRGWKFRHLDLVAFDYRVRPGSLVSKIRDPAVLKDILDRAITTHREVFESLFVEHMGHSLGSWPFLLLDGQERLRALASSSAIGEDGAALSLRERAARESVALSQARLATLEALREADAATWRLEHARSSARHFEESAQQLRDTLTARDEVVTLQQAALVDLRNRAEMAETALAAVQTESVAREKALTDLDRAHRAAVERLEERRESESLVLREEAEAARREAESLRRHSASEKLELEELRREVERLEREVRRPAWRRLWHGLAARLGLSGKLAKQE